MEQNLPEFLLNFTTMPKAGYGRKLVPSQLEMDAIARSCGLVAISAFVATIECKPWHRDGIVMNGHIKASIEQACVVSLEPVFEEIDTEFTARFLPENSKLAQPMKQIDGEIIFEYEGDDAPDLIEGEEINIWEVLLEYFNLAIEPFPRAKDLPPPSELEGQEADGVEEDDKISPFAVLAALKRNET